MQSGHISYVYEISYDYENHNYKEKSPLHGLSPFLEWPLHMLSQDNMMLEVQKDILMLAMCYMYQILIWFLNF